MQNTYTKLTYVVEASSLNAVGEELGYEWNTISDIIAKEEFYPDDGSGYIIIPRSMPKSYDEALLKIVERLFTEVPSHVNEIWVIED